MAAKLIVFSLLIIEFFVTPSCFLFAAFVNIIELGCTLILPVQYMRC